MLAIVFGPVKGISSGTSLRSPRIKLPSTETSPQPYFTPTSLRDLLLFPNLQALTQVDDSFQPPSIYTLLDITSRASKKETGCHEKQHSRYSIISIFLWIWAYFFLTN